MHKHDLDLIAALADSSLEDETEARALVESCPECEAEYQAQVEILGVLASMPTAAMSELEKAALHRDLWTELRKEPERSATPGWYRWTYVAAGLLVVVGLAGVLNGQIPLGGADDQGSFSEISSGLDTAAADDGGAQPFADVDPAGGEAESAGTTLAAEEALTFPFADLAEEARANQRVGDRSQLSTETSKIERCLEVSGLTDHTVVQELDLDQRYLVVMPDDEDVEQTVTFIAVDDCSVVFVDG
jgi:hypothetical protein